MRARREVGVVEKERRALRVRRGVVVGRREVRKDIFGMWMEVV
jgi:hypothetical protein